MKTGMFTTAALTLLLSIVSIRAAGSAPTYLINQNFEGAGQPAGWYVGGGTDFDYTTTALEGAQSTLVPQGGYGVELLSPTRPEVWWKFRYRRPASLPSSFSHIFLVGDENGAILRLTLLADGRLTVEGGGLTSALAADTTYTIWGHYRKGNGANAVVDIWYSTNDTRPGVGSQHIGYTNGWQATEVIGFGLLAEGSSGHNLFDLFQAATTDLESSGPPANTAPVANGQSVTTSEDVTLGISLSGSDAENSSLTYAVVTGPAHGILSGTAPNLTYQPAPNYHGPDSYTFKVNDGQLDSATATVGITVLPVNDPPVAHGQNVTTNEDTTLVITLSGSDSENSPLTYAVVTGPAHGTLSGTAPNLTYQPAADFNGSDIFTFKVNDGQVDSSAATVSIAVTAVNDAPWANTQNVSLAEDGTKGITLTGSDVENSPLTFALVTGPAHGTLSGTAPNLTYQPAANYNGPDNFLFKVNDGQADSGVTIVSISVTAVNDPPVAIPQNVSLAEDATKVIALAGIDVEYSVLTYAVVTGPVHGTLSGTGQSRTYQPAANYNGPDSFTFKVNDGQTDSSPATMSITVTAVNDAPVAITQSVFVAEDGTLGITLTGTDPENDSLTYAVVTSPEHGTLSGTAPNLTYQPATNYYGVDSFVFRVNDGQVDSVGRTVNIMVMGVNDAPTANPRNVNVAEDQAEVIVLTGTDVDNSLLQFSIVTSPAHGTLSGTTPILTYQPATNYNGPDSFTFKASDGGADSSPATVSITMTAVNDAPVAHAQTVSVAEDTTVGITLTGSDVENNPLTYIILGAPAFGTLSGTAPDLTYQPPDNYNGPDSFAFKVNDGLSNSATALVAINVTAVNDPPVANPQNINAWQNAAVGIRLAGTDIEKDPLTYLVVSGPTHGTLSGTGSNLTYQSAADYIGPDGFTFKVNDGQVDSSPATVSIMVTTVNAGADQLIGFPTAATLDGSISDAALPPGSTLSVMWSALSGPGDVTFGSPNSTNSVATFSAPGIYTLRLTADDGATTNSDDITIYVNGAPIVNAGPDRTIQFSSGSGGLTLEGSVSDDGLPPGSIIGIRWTVVSSPPDGVLYLMNPFSPTSLAAFNTPGVYVLGLIADDSMLTNSSTVTITVVQANRLPVANGQSVNMPEDGTVGITLSGSDADNNPLTYAVVTSPTRGTLSGTPPNLTYQPVTNFYGPDSFTFKVNDGQADSAAARVTINVTGVEDPPTAHGQNVTVTTNGTLGIILSGSDPENRSLTYAMVTSPAHGTLAGTAPNLTYQPAANYAGPDGFTFKVNDGVLDSSPATVLITVTTNAPPNWQVNAGSNQFINFQTPATLNGSVSDGGVPGGSTLSVTWNALSGPGTVAFENPHATNSQVTFSESGIYTLRLTADDGATTNSDDMTIYVNRAPAVRFGPDQTIAINSKALLNVEISDDGLSPGGYFNTTWTCISAPYGGQLMNQYIWHSLSFLTAFTKPGVYALRYVAYDSMASGTSDVTITVLPPASSPTVANGQRVDIAEDETVGITLTGSGPDNMPLTYMVVFGPEHGTLSGTPPYLTYQPATNFSGADYFTFLAKSELGYSGQADVTINIAVVNDPPVANAQSVNLAEDGSLHITLTGSDTDNTYLTYALVTSPAHGTLLGTAPYLLYRPAVNYNGPDSFTFKANDGHADSAAATVTINVTAVNDLPVAFGQDVSLAEDGTLGITLTGGDFDNTPLTYAVVRPPTLGFLFGTAPNLTYRPGGNSYGWDSFTFKVNDGQADSALATVTINVTPVNDRPVATGQFVSLAEDGTVGITLTGYDPENSPLTYAVVTSPAHGTLSGTAPDLTYQPATNYFGPDSFTFRSNDGQTNSTAATVTINVTAVNAAPVANGQNVNLTEDGTVAITLTGSDVENSPLTYAVLTVPGHGTLSGTPPGLTYQPAADYNGPDSVTFRANDGQLNSAAATVTITVAAVDDPPVANGQIVGVTEDVAVGISLSGSDPESSPLTYVVVTGPAHGTLSGTAPSLTYRPATNYNGPDSFTFKVNDGQLDSTPATIGITVAPVNDPPVAHAQTVAMRENAAAGITLSGSDPENSPLTYVLLTSPAHGTLSGTPPSLTYRPSSNYRGPDSFSFRVNDGHLDSVPALVEITVLPSNTPPVANGWNVATSVNTAVEITLSGSDPENSPLTYSVVMSPINGTLSGTPPNLTYQPAANFTGTDYFTFKVNDGESDSVVAGVAINVVLVNYPPVARKQNVSLTEDGAIAITLSGFDWEQSTLTYAVEASPAHGTLSGTPPDVTYQPAANYSGPDSFRFKVNDGQLDSLVAMVGITVVAVNDPPVADGRSVKTSENTAVGITLSGSDPDDNPLMYAVLTGPAHGTLSGTAPNLTYQPAANYSGPDSFTFKVNDGQFDSAAATVGITVSAVTGTPTYLINENFEDSGPPSDWYVGGVTDFHHSTPALEGTQSLMILQGGYGAKLLSPTRPEVWWKFRYRRTGSLPSLFSHIFSLGDTSGNLLRLTLLWDGRLTVDGVGFTSALAADTNYTIWGHYQKGNGADAVVDIWYSASDTRPGVGSQHIGYTNGLQVTEVFGLGLMAEGSSGSNVFDLFQVAATDLESSGTPVNSGPVVDAGLNQTNNALVAMLSGAVSNDGLPGTPVTWVWSKMSGPGSVVFGNASNLTTSVTFSRGGVYVFQLTASDPVTSSFDEVTIVANEPPQVYAGADQIINFSTAATLNGFVSDDGLPMGSVLSVTWSALSGPGIVSFGSPNAANSLATFSAPGIYALRLTAEDGATTNSQDVMIYVNGAPIVSAGTNQTIIIQGTALNGSVSDDGLPPGASWEIRWSVVSAPVGGVIALNNPFSPTALVGFNRPGVYVLRLNANDSMLSSSSDVTITVLPP